MRIFGQWFRFITACAVVGFMISTFCASPGLTGERERSEVRMTVDFTVLPIVLPDGSEAPAMPADPAAINGEASLPPDMSDRQAPKPDLAAAEQPGSELPPLAPEPPPVPKPAPQPEPKPVPTPTLEGGAMSTGTVQSIELAATGTGFSITVHADRPVGDTTYMNLTNPRRLVIDLREKWDFKGRNVIRSKGNVKHIVIGEHPDRLRLVIHFNTPPESGLKPAFLRKDTMLKVSVPAQ